MCENAVPHLFASLIAFFNFHPLLLHRSVFPSLASNYAIVKRANKRVVFCFVAVFFEVCSCKNAYITRWWYQPLVYGTLLGARALYFSPLYWY